MALVVKNLPADTGDMDAQFASLENLGKAIKSMDTTADYIAGVNNLKKLGGPTNPITPVVNIPKIDVPNTDTSNIGGDIDTSGGDVDTSKVGGEIVLPTVDENGMVVGDIESGTNIGSQNNGETNQNAEAQIVVQGGIHNDIASDTEGAESNRSKWIVVIIVILIVAGVTVLFYVIVNRKGATNDIPSEGFA